MKLRASKTGGFAGERKQLGPVDLADVPATTRGEIESSLDRVAFFELDRELPPDREIRDGYRYRITVQAEREHSVTWYDGSEAPLVMELAGLLRLLEEAAGGWRDVEAATADQAASAPSGGAWSCHRWEAFHDHMPPDIPRLRVTGLCRASGGGYQFTLRRKAPQGINPSDLLLELEIVEPEFGTDVLTDYPVEYVEETDTEYVTVSIIGVASSIPVQRLD